MKWFLLSIVFSVFLAMSCQDSMRGGRVVHKQIVYENVELSFVLDSILESGTSVGTFDVTKKSDEDTSRVVTLFAPLYKDSVVVGVIQVQRVDTLFELYDVRIDNKYPTKK